MYETAEHQKTKTILSDTILLQRWEKFLNKIQPWLAQNHVPQWQVVSVTLDFKIRSYKN